MVKFGQSCQCSARCLSTFILSFPKESGYSCVLVSTSVLHTTVRFELVCTFILKKDVPFCFLQPVNWKKKTRKHQAYYQNMWTLFCKTRPKPSIKRLHHPPRKSEKYSLTELLQVCRLFTYAIRITVCFFSHLIPDLSSRPHWSRCHGLEFLLAIAFEFRGGQIWGDGFVFNDG